MSVAAPSCVEANAAATATIVRGTDGLRWLVNRDLPARLVSTDGSVTRIGGWPEPTRDVKPDVERELELVVAPGLTPSSQPIGAH